MTRTKVLVSALLAAVTLAGCGVTIPSDVEGTLDRVRGGHLRVGVDRAARRRPG